LGTAFLNRAFAIAHSEFHRLGIGLGLTSVPMNFLRLLLLVLLGLCGAVISVSAQIVVTSSAFSSGGAIPAQFTCKGANHNPPLQLQGIPKSAKSLVLILDDPDAPGGTFNHWLMWNLDPTTSQIGERSEPAGAIQGTNDFGKAGYGGPCPPSGTHRYYFRIFALDRTLDLKAGARRPALEAAMKGHILGRSELMARFSH
jgi:Raf kinase inhibitor-like YbhB/YbcL family protein